MSFVVLYGCFVFTMTHVGSVCVSLRWHWVALGLTLNDDVISGVHNVVLY